MTPSPTSYLAPIGRLLLASHFLLSGPTKLMAPVATAGYMASAGLPGSARLAVAVGAFEVIGGLALALGWHTRLAAVLLAAFTLVASVLFHAFWAAPAEQQQVVQLLFTKNIALIGGLLFVTAAGAGSWGLDLRIPSRPKAPAGVFDA
jgi:putative oxidoreductase